MATAICCTLPSCTCECFAPGKSQIRTCEQCKHGWVAHALDKLTTTSLLPSLQVEVVQPNLVFDLASLVLYGTKAVPIRLKIVLDRLFSVLQEDEVAKILEGLGWTKEDYARGYIVQDSDGKVLGQWTCVLESEEGAIFNQFLRFGETRSIVELMIQDLQNQRNTPASPAKSESNIRAFIERMNKTRCQDTFSCPDQTNSSQCAKNKDEGTYDQSHISKPSQPVPSSSISRLQTEVQTGSQYRALSSPKRRKSSSTKHEHLSVPSIHLANLERTVLNAGAEPVINSTADIPATLSPARDSLTSHIQNSVTHMRKRTSLSSLRGSHRSILPRRRTKSAFTISANRKRVRCNVCNKWFYDKGTWKIHYSAVHLKVTYKCKVEGCNMVFSSLRSRNRHSANPNPKIHRIIEVADRGRMFDQSSSSGIAFHKVDGQWESASNEVDMEEESVDAQHNKEGELANGCSQTDDRMQETVDSDSSVIKLSVSHSEDDSSRLSQTDEEKNISPTKSLLASPRLSVSDSTLNTRTQKRKSNTPVRCLVVDDEDVKDHGDGVGTTSTTESDANATENIAKSPKVPEEGGVQQESLVDQDTQESSIAEVPNTVVCNVQSSINNEVSESSVIKTPVIKSEFVANSISDDEVKAQTSNLDSVSNIETSIAGASADKLHPSVPPELAGFSPSVDQMGLNADNCFFTLDGFPTCILCQKSFQSRQGVKVHYQNVHLRMMHQCTVDGCHAAFPSRRSRDRHSANNNLHRKILMTADVNQTTVVADSDHEASESESRHRQDLSSEVRLSSSDTSGSETNDTVKVEFETQNNSLQNSSLPPVSNPSGNRSPMKSPPRRPGLLPDSASPPDGTSVPVKAGGSQCLPYDSPTLVPPPHTTPKLSMADLWTGPRKSQGGLVCDICMKSYSTKDTLRTHYKNVHIREMHKCTVPGCEMMFSSVRSRNRHSQNPNLHRSFQEP